MTNEELVKKIQSGEDPGGCLLYELYDQNQGLIAKVIKKHGYTQYAEMDDLMQESFFAVHKAAFRWREGAGMGFPGYLMSWVRACLGRYVENFGGPVRIPAHKRKEIQRYSRYVSEYVILKGYRPSDSEIMGALDISLVKLDSIRKDMYRFNEVRSLDSPAGEDGESVIADFVRDPSDVHGETLDCCFADERSRAVWGAVDQLPKDQCEAVRMRYIDNMHLSDIGKHQGVSEERIRQKLKKAVNSLGRKHYRELSSFVDLSNTYSLGISFTGVGAFQHSGTSSTEWAALHEISREEEIRRERRETEAYWNRKEEKIKKMINEIYCRWNQKREEREQLNDYRNTDDILTILEP